MAINLEIWTLGNVRRPHMFIMSHTVAIHQENGRIRTFDPFIWHVIYLLWVALAFSVNIMIVPRCTFILLQVRSSIISML